MGMPGLGEAGMLPSATKEQEAAAIARLRAKGITNLTRTNIAEEIAVGGDAPAAQPVGPRTAAPGGMGQRIAPPGSIEERLTNPDAARKAAQDEQFRQLMMRRSGMLPLSR